MSTVLGLEGIFGFCGTATLEECKKDDWFSRTGGGVNGRAGGSRLSGSALPSGSPACSRDCDGATLSKSLLDDADVRLESVEPLPKKIRTLHLCLKMHGILYRI